MRKKTFDNILEEHHEKNQKLSKEHFKIDPKAQTKEFEDPEDVDLSNPETWHKKIYVPFVEDKVTKFFRRKVKVVEQALLYGLTKKDKAIWVDY